MADSLRPAQCSYIPPPSAGSESSSGEDVTARSVVLQRLTTLGVPLPVGVRGSKLTASNAASPAKRSATCCFGVALDKCSHEHPVQLQSEWCSALPCFLVFVIQYLERFLTSDGLFRKTGSLQKQRTLRTRVCETDGATLDDVSEYDAASLLKQYLRLLPGGMIPRGWKDSLTAVANRYAGSEPEQLKEVLMDMVFLMPERNQACLAYTSRFLHQLVRSSRTTDSEKVSTILAPSIMQCSGASNSDLSTLTCILKIFIENAESIGIADTSAAALTIERPFTPTEVASSSPVLISPSTELRSLRQKRSLRSAAASPGHIAVGSCVDSRLMEICSSNESLASPSTCKLSPVSEVSHAEAIDERRSPAKEKKRKHKRRSSLSGLVNSIGQTFERLKTQKAAPQPLRDPHDCAAMDVDQPKVASPPRQHRPIIGRPSLHRAAKSTRGRVAAVHPNDIPTGTRAVSPLKRKAPADETHLLSPQKRKAMLQALANNDCMVNRSTLSLATGMACPQPMAPLKGIHGDNVQQQQEAAGLSVVRDSSLRGSFRSVAGEQMLSVPTGQLLYVRTGNDKENMSKKKSGRRSSCHLEFPRPESKLDGLDSDEAKALALLSESAPKKKKSKLRRRLSGGLIKKEPAEDKVAHIMEVGERLANLRSSRASSRMSSQAPSRCTTPTASSHHMRWNAPPGSLPPTNSPTAFACSVPASSSSVLLATDSQTSSRARHMSLPRESHLTGVQV
eukprot:scpid37839/ scgid10415/ Rho GTPase-activating protein 11A; Rho-type GTPase-activating protein 11A